MAENDHQALPAVAVLTSTLYCLFGLWVWTAHLALVYIAHHLACRTAFPPAGLVESFVIGITITAVAMLAGGALKPRWLAAVTRSPRDEVLKPFYVSVMRWLVLLGTAGVLWAGSAAAFLSACAT